MTENQDEVDPADLTEARERRLGEERKERTEPWLDPEAAATQILHLYMDVAYDFLVFINLVQAEKSNFWQGQGLYSLIEWHGQELTPNETKFLHVV